MNNLKNFLIFKNSVSLEFFILSCDNFNYKNFNCLNNFFVFKNKKILFKKSQLHLMSFLNKIFIYLKNSFVFKKKTLINFKCFLILNLIKKLHKKLFLVYFKKEKNFFLCGFLGVSSVGMLKKNIGFKNSLFTKFSLTLTEKNSNSLKFCIKKKNRFLVLLLRSTFLINKKFNFFSFDSQYYFFSNFFNLPFNARFSFKIVQKKENLLKYNFIPSNRNKSFLFLKKKLFNLNFY